MTIKKNYTWMIATMLAVGLLVGLVFSFSTVKAFSEDPGPGSMSVLAEDGYRLVTVSASNEPNSSGGIALSSSPAAVSAGCTLDTTNAVSYWPLNETSGTNFSDSMPAANDGSCSQSPCPTPVEGAAAGGQFFINTEEDIINVQPTTDFDWTITDDFSIGVWVKTTQDCMDENKVFFGRHRGGQDEANWWLGCVQGGKARFHLRDSDTVEYTTDSSTQINDGKWHYIVGVRDATADPDENRIYVDGILETTVISPGYTGTFTSSDVITIGGYHKGSPKPYYLSGALDEVAVFNVALTVSDINTYLDTCPFPFVPNVGDVAFTTDENVAIDITGAELLANSGGGLTIDSIVSPSEQGGTITGSDPYTYTPPADDSGTDFFTFVAKDGSSNTAPGNAIITINPVEAPDVEVPADQTNDEGDVVSLQIVATDPQGQVMTYEATKLPPDLEIDDTGLISGTIAYTASPNSPYDVTVTVTDEDDNATSVDFTWTVNRVNQTPEVTDPSDQSDVEGADVSLQIVATDANDDPLTYGATNLPDGLSINTSTGLISGTIAAGASDFSPYTVTVSVDDGEAPAEEVTFEWTVARDNSPPVVTNPGDQTNTEEDNVSLQIVATDAEDDTLVYGATELPPGLSISTSTGLISGVIDAGASAFSPYNVTVTVDDGFVATPVEVEFTWTVNGPMRYVYLPIVIRQD